MGLDKLLRDLRFGLRSLRQSPGFTATAIVTLALGVGANTAVFSLMNAVLLRSLPVSDPDRLVYVRTTNPPHGTGTIDSNKTFSYAVYDALRRQGGALSPLMAYVPLAGSKVAVRYGADPEEAEGDMVSGTFFSGLGVKIVRGLGFSERDETNHAAIAVISYNYWTRRFARNPDVLGTALYVNGVPITIVGVAAEGFEGVEGGGSTDFWIPLQSRPGTKCVGQSAGRRKELPCQPNMVVPAAHWTCRSGQRRSAGGGAIATSVSASSLCGAGHADGGREAASPDLADAKNFPGYSEMYGDPLRMLMAMVGLVLLIALTNVVMLLVARNGARQREFSVRQALGAGRGELLRQLLAESLILVTAGGALAWGFAEMATRLLGSWAQIESNLSPDRTVLLFTLGVLAMAALLLAVAPLRGAGRRSPAGIEDIGGRGEYRYRQIARGQSDCGPADGALPGAAGGRRTADSHPAQFAKYSSGNADRRPGGFWRETQHPVGS